MKAKTLFARLADAKLTDGDNIILKKSGGCAICVSREDFEKLFAAALAQENAYEALCEADKNPEKGYAEYFSKWNKLKIFDAEDGNDA